VKPPSINPFRAFRKECDEALKGAVQTAFPSYAVDQIRLAHPPTSDFGDLASSLCFELAKKAKKPPTVLAEQIVEAIGVPSGSLLGKVEAAGGYINFYADYAAFSELTLESVRALGPAYGYVKTDTPVKIIVEHTSVNPAGPIHVGTARNSMLGDALYRLLKARGHEVSANFYVDDVGRQIAILAYGFQLVSHLPRKDKIDHWLGLVYAVTSCIIEIEKLKRTLQTSRDGGASEGEVRKIQMELDDWVSAAGYLCERDEGMFYGLVEKIQQDENPESSIARIMRSRGEGDSSVSQRGRGLMLIRIQGNL
jgi:arginyl-tRNA synthetase